MNYIDSTRETNKKSVDHFMIDVFYISISHILWKISVRPAISIYIYIADCCYSTKTFLNIN